MMKISKLEPGQIHGFSESLLKPSYDDPQPTPDLHYELWELMCRPEPRISAAAPRGHAKSTAITHAFTLACVLFRFRSYGLIVSDTEPQAIEFLADIRRELVENDQLRQVFGVNRIIKDTEKTVIVELINDDGSTQEFRLSAKGSGQSMRGTKWRNKRPDLIVCDDLENDEIVENEERREKFKRWFYNALLPAGSKNCIVRVVGTVLHFDSLLENMMPQIGDPDTIDTPLKMWSTYEVTESDWIAVKYRAHSPDFDEILWPEMYSRERLEFIRRGYKKQGIPEGYAQEYLNYPLDDATSYFRKADMVAMKEDERDIYLEYYIAGDLAISAKDRRAFTVFAVVGIHANTGRARVVDIVRFRGDALEILEQMFMLNDVYKPELFFIEQENIARTLGPIINQQMMKRQKFIPIKEMTATQDKEKRARAFQVRHRAKSIEFDTAAPWYGQLELEMLQFPKGTYLDQVDALAWIFLGMDHVTEVSTFKERMEELREQEEDEYDDEYGISEITGY